MRVKFVYEGHQVKVIGADKVLIAYLKGTVLSVSDNSESVNIKINKKNPHSRSLPPVPMNKLGSWLIG